MQNLYPLFERNRILKKELLWSLRDYSFGHIQLEYQEYADGIISGCKVLVKEGELVIGPGIIKWEGFIYLISEALSIPYEPLDQTQILKLCMEKEVYSQDYISYRMEPVLDTGEEKERGALEVCRFHLRKGAKLREEYSNLEDMQTEYDTVNFVDSDWGGLRETTLNPAITNYFAEVVMTEENATAQDLAFAWMCKNERRAVAKEVIANYCKRRGSLAERCVPDNRQLFQALNEVLLDIHNGATKTVASEKKHRRIIVD